MKLKSYLEIQDISMSEMARYLKVSPATISALISGLRRPSMDVAIAIFDASHGAVGLEDWRR